MEIVSELIKSYFLSFALILGIIIMLLENRKERPQGTDHIIVIVVVLSLIVLNKAADDLFRWTLYDDTRNYTDDAAMTLMYMRSALEHILFPLIAYIELLLIVPVKKKYVFFLPELICIIAESVNLGKPGIIFSYNKHLDYVDGPLMLLPYFVGMIYLLLLMRYSILFIKEKEMSKGVTVIFIVFLTLAECYLEAAYIVVDVMDEIVALDVIIYYFYLVAIYQSEMKIKLRTSELELERSKRMLMLSQIQPHFMYNSLTSITYLCDKDASQAKRALIDFSKFLRKNLEAMTNKNIVPIKEELEHTQVYLSLEKIRFGDDLDIIFDVKDSDFSVPVLTVQPLVENAVKHGINRSESGCGTVCISTEETDSFHKVIIKDDGGGFDVESLNNLDEGHIGISNVRKRLLDECGGELIIKSAPNEGTECTILIPKENHYENSGN
ncbi:MAG: histidine kinase [Ruminococcus sp.]|uniref:sensor histidine kinase n=1 Tax=Ruminococcus sp. TaxID=41978 RepID=UPI001B15D617|nr:histidine kinase [Ruminococcus sp.]MBO7474151.1 histidine kinase [Ruminococcus sp.]